MVGLYANYQKLASINNTLICQSEFKMRMNKNNIYQILNLKMKYYKYKFKQLYASFLLTSFIEI